VLHEVPGDIRRSEVAAGWKKGELIGRSMDETPRIPRDESEYVRCRVVGTDTGFAMR